MPHKRKDLNIKGSNLWYLVGLITSDGCLSKDGIHIDITSNNYDFLEGIRKATGLQNKIGVKYDQNKHKAFRIQIANRGFYDFLLSIGLMPKKSLIIQRVDVPDNYFFDFLRGLIDGDGGMQRWIHKGNGREQWNLRILSGSKPFLAWIQQKIKEIIGVEGRFHCHSPTQLQLKYGKMAARIIAQKCYYDGCLGLERKIALAKSCVSSYAGWENSKTVLDSNLYCRSRDVGIGIQ